MLKNGQIAPEFELPDQSGKIHRLSDYRGKWVLIYFYPKDFTPGCTVQACTIRDSWPDFEKLKIKVFGISADTIESHKKMLEKHKLPFDLLGDPEKKTLNAYGVWKMKKFLGREFMGILRTSFLINPDGKIFKIYEKVKPTEHAKEVLQDLKKVYK